MSVNMASIETFTGTSLSAGPVAKKSLDRHGQSAHPVHVDVGPCPVVAGGAVEICSGLAGPRLGWLGCGGWPHETGTGSCRGPRTWVRWWVWLSWSFWINTSADSGSGPPSVGIACSWAILDNLGSLGWPDGVDVDAPLAVLGTAALVPTGWLLD